MVSLPIVYIYKYHLQVIDILQKKQQALEEKLLEKAQVLLRPYPQYAFVQVCITPTLPEDETKVQPENNFIEATWIPDEFYRKLIHEINVLYAHDLPISIPILLRKLFENLIIGILRKNMKIQDYLYISIHPKAGSMTFQSS